MIRLKHLLKENTNELIGQNKVIIPQTSQTLTLDKLATQIINDTNTLIIENLLTIKKLINKEILSDDDISHLNMCISNYNRYFDRTNGGTPEVIRGEIFIKELQKLL